MTDHVNRLTIVERTPTAEQLGARLRVTNAERERLKLWPFKPVDVTDERLAEQRKAKERERAARRRRERGVKPRSAYLAELASKPRPWEAEGISQRTWQRRQKACREVRPTSREVRPKQ